MPDRTRSGSSPHVVAVLAFDGVVLGDLATPCELFAHVPREGGVGGYHVRVCGVSREVAAEHCAITPPFSLAGARRADTIIVPGIAHLDVAIPAQLIMFLRQAAARGTRIASICSGAFVLAATGLLDGLPATTHWAAADELARRYPRIDVDRNVLYVDNGNLLTSAGAAAAFDLCLHMIRKDYGAAVAARTARAAVMPLERAGGQSQFIEHAPPVPANGSLQSLLVWIEKNPSADLTVQALADRAATSVRTLHRRFADQTSVTPASWVLHCRIRRAQTLLETTDWSIERVGQAAGFGSASTFRERFLATAGTTPKAYRRSFRSNMEGTA